MQAFTALKSTTTRPVRAFRPITAHAVSSGSAQKPDARSRGDGAALLRLAANATLLGMAVSAVAAQPASARDWHERRHHRRLDVEDTPTQQRVQPAKTRVQPAKADATVGQAVASQIEVVQGLKQLQRSIKRAYRNAIRSIQGDTVYVESYSARDMPAQARSSRDAYGEASSFVGWLLVAVAAGLGLLLALKVDIPWPWGRRRRGGEGGKWVRDRSLGGKMVFVPDAEKPSKKSLWGNDVLPPATPSEAAAASSSPGSLSTLGSSSGTDSAAWAKSSGAAADQRRPVLPEWWVPVNTAVYCTASRKEELQKQAKAVLRELEDAKLTGMDYPLSSLRALRTLCQEGGGLQVKPRTENGRDAVLRTGVRAAMESAMEGSTQLLGGVEPGRFVCGLAHDLGVPDPRAVTITHAEVAACSRSLLITCEAAYRAGDQAEIMLSLLKLVQLLAAFPLPLRSAEAELVASSIQQQTSMEFRRAIFFNFGYMDASRAPLLAEMLGFNPDLVMPQLYLQLQAAEQAERLAAQQAQNEVASEAAQQQQGQGQRDATGGGQAQ